MHYNLQGFVVDHELQANGGPLLPSSGEGIVDLTTLDQGAVQGPPVALRCEIQSSLPDDVTLPEVDLVAWAKSLDLADNDHVQMDPQLGTGVLPVALSQASPRILPVPTGRKSFGFLPVSSRQQSSGVLPMPIAPGLLPIPSSPVSTMNTGGSPQQSYGNLAVASSPVSNMSGGTRRNKVAGTPGQKKLRGSRKGRIAKPYKAPSLSEAVTLAREATERLVENAADSLEAESRCLTKKEKNNLSNQKAGFRQRVYRRTLEDTVVFLEQLSKKVTLGLTRNIPHLADRKSVV